MNSTQQPPYRYVRALRRARLARLAAIGAIAVVPAACGNGDAAEFASAQQPAAVVDEAAAAATTAAGTSTTAPATTTAGSTTTAGDATAVVGESAPVEVVVGFTYAASATSGPVRNPYVAVWIEDADGNLVDTVSVWFEQSGKGSRYLSDLRSWYSAAGGDADATSSGATRVAGTYTVAWDGTDLDGNPVAAGEYVVFVEAAREHGPYSISSAPLTIGGSSATLTLPDDGELSALTATVTVAG